QCRERWQHVDRLRRHGHYQLRTHLGTQLLQGHLDEGEVGGRDDVFHIDVDPIKPVLLYQGEGAVGKVGCHGGAAQRKAAVLATHGQHYETALTMQGGDVLHELGVGITAGDRCREAGIHGEGDAAVESAVAVGERDLYHVIGLWHVRQL